VQLARFFAIAIFGIGYHPAPSFAAEIVGVDEPASEDAPEAAPAPRSLPRGTKNQPRQIEREDYDDSFIQDVGVSGTVGFSGGFTANLSVSLGLNRYTAIDLSGFYLSWATEDQSEVRYGPEVDLVLRYPNSTMFTPFIGAGPGFEKWKREKDDQEYDLSSSLTANYFAGINLGLSRHFGFQIQSRWVTYVNDPPRDFKKPDKKEPQTQSRVGIGFYFAI